MVLNVSRKVESIQQVRCTDTVVIMLLGINVGSPSQVEKGEYYTDCLVW